MTITEEAKQLGISVLPVRLEHSDARFKLERTDEKLAIRLPFSAIGGVSEQAAQIITLERERRAFADLEDFYARVLLPVDTLRALVQAGVFECFGFRRDVLWLLGMLEHKPRPEQSQAMLFESPAITEDDLAMLEGLDETATISCDLQATRTSLETHPMTLHRANLETADVRRLDRIFDGQHCTIAGLVIARQHPETAGGFVFLYLEDETGHCQGIVHPDLWQEMRVVLRSRALLLTGKVQRLGGWKTIVVSSAVPLEVLSARESEMAYFVR